MSDFEFRFKTKKGELVVHFDNIKELESKISQIDSIVDFIDKKMSGIQLETQTQILQGLENLYTFNTDGLVKLLKFPKNKSDIIRFALFVSSKSLNLKELTKITGITNPLAYMVSKHFMKLSDGTYTLEADGRNYVASKVIPSIQEKSD